MINSTMMMDSDSDQQPGSQQKLDVIKIGHLQNGQVFGDPSLEGDSEKQYRSEIKSIPSNSDSDVHKRPVDELDNSHKKNSKSKGNLQESQEFKFIDPDQKQQDMNLLSDMQYENDRVKEEREKKRRERHQFNEKYQNNMHEFQSAKHYQKINKELIVSMMEQQRKIVAEIVAQSHGNTKSDIEQAIAQIMKGYLQKNKKNNQIEIKRCIQQEIKSMRNELLQKEAEQSRIISFGFEEINKRIEQKCNEVMRHQINEKIEEMEKKCTEYEEKMKEKDDEIQKLKGQLKEQKLRKKQQRFEKKEDQMSEQGQASQ